MKVAIVGTGKIVGEALYAMQFVEGMDVVAICSRPRSEAKARELATQYYINNVYTDYDRLLEDPDVEFVYVGIVNSAHYEYGLKALLANKHVIMEKPFTARLAEAEELQRVALQRGRYLFEAVTLFYMDTFEILRNSLQHIGRVRLVQSNYSQFSSRYYRYLVGEIAPAFDPALAGGALNDINIYNINLVVGLFGEPLKVVYFSNCGPNGIDTSGVCLMKYDGFVASCTGAKDSASPGFAIIQGEKGWIRINGIPSIAEEIECHYNNKEFFYNNRNYPHRMVPEFTSFVRMFENRDYTAMQVQLETTLSVMRTQERAHSSNKQ